MNIKNNSILMFIRRCMNIIYTKICVNYINSHNLFILQLIGTMGYLWNLIFIHYQPIFIQQLGFFGLTGLYLMSMIETTILRVWVESR